jgi:hypothetical protein
MEARFAIPMLLRHVHQPATDAYPLWVVPWTLDFGQINAKVIGVFFAYQIG